MFNNMFPLSILSQCTHKWHPRRVLWSSRSKMEAPSLEQINKSANNKRIIIVWKPHSTLRVWKLHSDQSFNTSRWWCLASMQEGMLNKVCASNYRCRLHSGHKIYITNYNIQMNVSLLSLLIWGQLTSKNNLIFCPLSLLQGIRTRRSKYVRKMKLDKDI
jgi:hypothetical protein